MHRFISTSAIRIGLICSLSALTAGCGRSSPEILPVEGTVLVKGKPVAGLRVYFHPDVQKDNPEKERGYSSTGITDEQGRYTLTYDHPELPRPGAILGPHVVVIHDPALEGRNNNGGGIKYSLDYTRVLNTPLRADVKSGNQTFDFDIK